MSRLGLRSMVPAVGNSSASHKTLSSRNYSTTMDVQYESIYWAYAAYAPTIIRLVSYIVKHG